MGVTSMQHEGLRQSHGQGQVHLQAAGAGRVGEFCFADAVEQCPEQHCGFPGLSRVSTTCRSVQGRVELVNEGDEGKEVTEESLKSGITSFLFQRTKSVKL